ncbi:MAG: T9SS type A sorting domain-containing protein [Parafilimonas sp.]
MKFIAITLAVALFPIIAKAQIFSPSLAVALHVINNSSATPKTKEPEIFSFTVVKSSLLAQLNWSAFSGKNNKGFRIERSSDGILFSQVAIVPSQAGSSTPAQKLNYIYFDDKPFSGMNYYRLSQTDSTGNELYSAIAEVSFAKDSINVYPNPAKDNITIDGLAGNESIELYNQNGQLVKNKMPQGQ